MSPRLVGYQERKQHDFGFVLPVTHTRAEQLFGLGGCPIEQVPVNCHVGPHGIMAYEGNLIIYDIAIDRGDVSLQLTLGSGKTAGHFCGPWMQKHLVELFLIQGDAIAEGRVAEASKIQEEVKKYTQKVIASMKMPILVPVRQTIEGYVRLLPNAPEGHVSIHLRTLHTVDVQ